MYCGLFDGERAYSVWGVGAVLQYAGKAASINTKTRRISRAFGTKSFFKFTK